MDEEVVIQGTEGERGEELQATNQRWTAEQRGSSVLAHHLSPFRCPVRSLVDVAKEALWRSLVRDDIEVVDDASRREQGTHGRIIVVVVLHLQRLEQCSGPVTIAVREDALGASNSRSPGIEQAVEGVEFGGGKAGDEGRLWIGDAASSLYHIDVTGIEAPSYEAERGWMRQVTAFEKRCDVPAMGAGREGQEVIDVVCRAHRLLIVEDAHVGMLVDDVAKLAMYSLVVAVIDAVFRKEGKETSSSVSARNTKSQESVFCACLLTH